MDTKNGRSSTLPKLGRPKSMVTVETHSSPSLDVHPKSLSFENLSLTETEQSKVLLHIGDQRTALVTSTEYLTAQQFDTDTDHTHTDIERHRLAL